MMSTIADTFITNMTTLGEKVNSIVETYPTKPGGKNEKTVASHVREQFDNQAGDYIKHFYEYADALIEAGTGSALAGKAKYKDLMPSNTDKVDNDILYVELLTAVWLGLYFFGVPDGRPWDKVLRWAEERGGGLPNGICVGKAIGDLVRSSRKAHLLYANKQIDADPGTLLVHSYLPMIAFPRLVQTGSGPSPRPAAVRSALPAEVHAVGRCYEFLQLKLYATAGYPFVYSVPKRFVVSQYESDINPDRRSGWNAWQLFDDFCKSLRQRISLNDVPSKDQGIVILDQDRPPACFVNSDTGLFTFEGIDVGGKSDELPLPASYMRAERRKRYYERLVDGIPKLSDNSIDPERNLLAAEYVHRASIYQCLFENLSWYERTT